MNAPVLESGTSSADSPRRNAIRFSSRSSRETLTVRVCPSTSMSNRSVV